MRSLATLGLIALCAAACARGAVNTAVAPPAPPPTRAHCANCDPMPMDEQMARAVEERIADLKARGGECSTYGVVLEDSYRNGRITIRQYMWRVGTRLAAGQANDNGDMTLAREIDSLNVGLRTVNEVTLSMEHEAMHIAFRIPSGPPENEALIEGRVRACRSERKPSFNSPS